MTRLLAVAAREVRERRLVLAAAGLAGVLVLAVPALLASRDPIRDGWIVFGVAASFSAALALGFGFYAVGGELSARRMSFYFTRPLSARGIFGGKIAGALALIVGCQALGLGPSVAFVPAARDLLVVSEMLKFLELGTITCLAAGCAVGVITQARSAWVLADVVGAAAVVGLGWVAGERIGWTYGHFGVLARDHVGRDLEILAAVVSVLVLLAAARGLARGRTIGARVHRVFTLTLWPALLGLGAVAYVAPVVALRATPADLREIQYASVDPTGRYVDVTGVGPHGLRLDFLCEVTTMSCVRRNGEPRSPSQGQPAFSAHGERAAAVRFDVFSGRWRATTVTVFEMAPSGLAAEIVPLQEQADGDASLAGAPDGARFAILADDWVASYDVDTRHVAQKIDLPTTGTHSWWQAAVFLDRQHVRAFRGVRLNKPKEADRTALEIWEIDLGGAPPRRAGRIELAQNDSVVVAPGGDRVAILPNPEGGLGPSEIAFHDGRDGRLAAHLACGAARGLSFLADGGVVVVEQSGRAQRIRAFDRDLGAERSTEIQGLVARIQGELGAGQFVVSATAGAAGAARRAVYLVDVTAGTARQVATGLRSIGRPWSDLSNLAVPRGEAAKLFLSDAGELVRFDPLTGDRRVLLPLGR